MTMLEHQIPFLFTAAVLVTVILLAKRQAIRAIVAQHERNMAAMDALMAEITAWSEAELAKTRAALARPIEGESDWADETDPLPFGEEPDEEEVGAFQPTPLPPDDATDDITDDEREFLAAMAEYQQRSGRQLPSWREALVVLKRLGYRKGTPLDPAPR